MTPLRKKMFAVLRAKNLPLETQEKYVAEIAEMAARAGLPCTPHSANLSLVTICTMHLLGAIPNAGKYLEFSIEEEDYYPWQYGLFRGDPFAVEGGRVRIPDGPGWGVEINPDWLDRARYKVSERER